MSNSVLKELRHPINFRCPSCGASAGERCINVPSTVLMIRKYHNTREAVARNAAPSERFVRMRKHG
jgi:hypothetical protein